MCAQVRDQKEISCWKIIGKKMLGNGKLKSNVYSCESDLNVSVELYMNMR